MITLMLGLNILYGRMTTVQKGTALFWTLAIDALYIVPMVI